MLTFIATGTQMSLSQHNLLWPIDVRTHIIANTKYVDLEFDGTFVHYWNDIKLITPILNQIHRLLTFFGFAPTGCCQFFINEIFCTQHWRQWQTNRSNELWIFDFVLQFNQSDVVHTRLISLVWEYFGDWHLDYWIGTNRTRITVSRRIGIPFA